MGPLQGVGVLVTRPAEQAAALCRMLEGNGARTVRLPTIEIRALHTGVEASASTALAHDFDLVIFTSANAVTHGIGRLDRTRVPEIAAIGSATARALRAAGCEPDLLPVGSVDSPGLLRTVRLAQPAGQRILIITGRGGRGELQQELTARGAMVSRVEVYQRFAANPSAEALASVDAELAAGTLQIVTATSVEIAEQLLRIVPPASRRALERIHWLIPGERIATALHALGVMAPHILAASAEDQDLVGAALSWRSALPASAGGSIA